LVTSVATYGFAEPPDQVSGVQFRYSTPTRLGTGEELPEVAQAFQRQPHEPVNPHACRLLVASMKQDWVQFNNKPISHGAKPFSPTRLKTVCGNYHLDSSQSPCVLVVGYSLRLAQLPCVHDTSIRFHQQEYGLLWVRPMQSIGMNDLGSVSLQDTLPQRSHDRLHTCQSTHFLEVSTYFTRESDSCIVVTNGGITHPSMRLSRPSRINVVNHVVLK